MQGLCAEKKAIGPRKQRDCSTLQSIADKKPANRDQARDCGCKLNSFLWGAPRVHGEIRKLRINVSQTTVAKYMGPRTTRPPQSWRVFLRNHARELIRSGDFRDQRDDLERRCSWPGSTVDEILSADLLDSSCAKSSSRQPGESIERVAGMVLFPSRAALRGEILFESRGPPSRRTKSAKHEIHHRSPPALGGGLSRSPPTLSRSRRNSDRQTIVVVASSSHAMESLKSVA